MLRCNLFKADWAVIQNEIVNDGLPSNGVKTPQMRMKADLNG